MAARRQDRINEEVARELTSILRSVKEPRVPGAFLSVTGADVSRDLSLARVYYSILGEAEGAEKGLSSAAGYIRSELAKRLNARTVPELVFVDDDSSEAGFRIREMLDAYERERVGNVEAQKPTEE